MGRRSNAAANAFIAANGGLNDKEAVAKFGQLFYPISVEAYRRRRQRLGAMKPSGRPVGATDNTPRYRRTKKEIEREKAKEKTTFNNCDITTGDATPHEN